MTRKSEVLNRLLDRHLLLPQELLKWEKPLSVKDLSSEISPAPGYQDKTFVVVLLKL